MKVAKVVKTCQWILICDKAYFISVHVLVYYIRGNECWTSIHTLPFSTTRMAELLAPRLSWALPWYSCLLRGWVDPKVTECGQMEPVTWKFQGSYQESHPETPTLWCSASTNCTTHTTHSIYIHLKHFHLQSSDLFLLQQIPHYCPSIQGFLSFNIQTLLIPNNNLSVKISCSWILSSVYCRNPPHT